MRDQASQPLTDEDAHLIRFLHFVMGFQHKRIAALYDVNQGRISEICTGQKHQLTKAERQLDALATVVSGTWPKSKVTAARQQ